MLFVPGGHYVYRGRPYDGTKEATTTREFDLAPYCIDEFEIASYNYLSSCKDCELRTACRANGLGLSCLTQKQATAYCARRTDKSPGRLPLAEEILFAAQGNDGRKFPWGSSLYPWGASAEADRPPPSKGFFCDFEINEGQISKERQILFGPGCAVRGPSLDVSPFGVKNLASNLLEWTSGTFVEGDETYGVVLGVDYSRARDPGFSPDEDMAPRLRVSSDERRHLELRAHELVGFRCVTTKKPSASAPAGAP